MKINLIVENYFESKPEGRKRYIKLEGVAVRYIEGECFLLVTMQLKMAAGVSIASTRKKQFPDLRFLDVLICHLP